MKKIMGLEQSIKMYKFTAKDVAKCLGDCLHDGSTMNVSKEELEEMHAVSIVFVWLHTLRFICSLQVLRSPPCRFSFSIFQAATTTNSQAADATLSLRLAQKVAEINAMLDAELQQALRDVPPSLREKVNHL
jgi:hypothetical protein